MCLKNPNWNDSEDRNRYERIIEKSLKRELTSKEKDFYMSMYHQEEFYAYGEC